MIMIMFESSFRKPFFALWRGRGGHSFSPHPFFCPPRPSGRLGEGCETPAAFRSKWVRADFSIGHQTGNCKFWEVDSKTCSPRLRARLARNEDVKSNGGTKSQEAIFSEMRRFVPIFLTKSEISARNFGEAIFPA